MITPWTHQEEISNKAALILKEHMIVYLAMEERTGKSLTALLIASKVKVSKVLILTKKKALKDWLSLLDDYPIPTLEITATNYHQAWKLKAKYDLVILDESHNYLSAYPKIGASSKQLAELRKGNKPNRNIYDAVKKLAYKKPIVYLSATPYAQGPQLLYHQLALSSWSPFRDYSNFYNWFRAYGKPYQIEVRGRQVTQYDRCENSLIVKMTEHLFITKTRAELGFEHEPVDKLHYITLGADTKSIYNELLEDKLVFLDEFPEPLVCDTVMKLRTSLHMLEGGTAKIDVLEKPNYIVLSNYEKIWYIKKHFGDKKSVVIMYNYKAELIKLQKHFKKAVLLQATSYAEGVDLSGYESLIVYSQDFSTARHTQRRARQCNKGRDTPITIHYLLVKGAVSEQVYKTVSVNKRNFVDSVFEAEKL
jgi:hypothetical protein